MYKYEKENNKIKVTITVAKEEWDNFVEQAYEQNKEKYSVQGFRKGKAPRRVIEQNYGANVFFDDALDLAFSTEYRKVFENEKDFDPIDQPDLKIEKFDDTGLVLIAEVENMPEVTLGAYTGLSVQSAKGEITEEQINKEIAQAQQRLARFVEVERDAKNGDVATIDFTGSVDGVKFDGGSAENYRLELGSKSFIDTFEDQIVGMHTGETRDVNVTFPENYGATDLQNKKALFVVTLKKLEEKRLPDLDDSFASSVSEFETFAEYKEDIKKHLEESLKSRLERETENNILSAVVKNATVEIPECLVERQLDLFIRDFETRLSYQGVKLEDYLKYIDKKVEDLREERREQSKETVKTRLVLEKIITEQKLTLKQEEIDSKIEEIASKYKKTVDEYKKSMGEKQLAYFENDILMDKLLKYLKENNTIA